MRRGCTHEPTQLVTKWDALSGEMVTDPDYGNWWVRGVCEYGHCVELNCPVCGCNQGGWGPVYCPCEDWKPYRAMRRQPRPTPVKPSVRRFRPSRRHH